MRRVLFILFLLIIGMVFLTVPREGEYQGKKQSQWIEELRSEDKQKRIAAIQALGEIGSAEGKAMSEPRRTALYVIHKIGWAKYASMVPPLIAQLNDQQESVRDATVEALKKIGPYAKEDLQEAAENFNDLTTRWGALAVLRNSPELGVTTDQQKELSSGLTHPFYAKYFPKSYETRRMEEEQKQPKEFHPPSVPVFSK